MHAIASTIKALQGFAKKPSNQILYVQEKGWWGHLVVARKDSVMTGNSDLTEVCSVARAALEKATPRERQKLNKGLSHLRTRCLQYLMTDGRVSCEMGAFFKTLHLSFPRSKCIIERIKSWWPFKRHSSLETAPKHIRPGVKITQQGKVGESALPRLSSLRLHANKAAIFNKILKDKPMTGELEYLKFVPPQDEDLLRMSTTLMKNPCNVTSYVKSYDYEEVHEQAYFTCHVNFGDKDLFGFWKSSLAAQDELMVMNFPTLGLLAEHLKGWFSWPSTKGTPWLIKGATRYGSVDENALYGDQLSNQSPEVAASHVSQRAAPSSKNILVLTALHVSENELYSFNEILTHFKVAYTGFKGAKQQADLLHQRLAICTGNWGTGAFGNDPVKMGVIQILAARFAGVDALKYFTFDPKGQENFEKAQRFVNAMDALHEQADITPTLGSLLHLIHQAEFRHGVGNGT